MKLNSQDKIVAVHALFWEHARNKFAFEFVENRAKIAILIGFFEDGSQGEGRLVWEFPSDKCLVGIEDGPGVGGFQGGPEHNRAELEKLKDLQLDGDIGPPTFRAAG